MVIEHIQFRTRAVSVKVQFDSTRFAQIPVLPIMQTEQDGSTRRVGKGICQGRVAGSPHRMSMRIGSYARDHDLELELVGVAVRVGHSIFQAVGPV